MDNSDRRTGELGIAVEHRARLAGGVALAAAVMTVAWFARALQAGSAPDWFWCAVCAVVGVLQLLVVRDSRAPLMLADDQGVRVRHGETWSGLRWQDIDHVEVQSPGSRLRDGRIVVHPRAAPYAVEDAGSDTGSDAGSASPQGSGPDAGNGDDAAAVEVLSSEAFTVPLAATTRLQFDGLTGDLVADLDALASGRTPVLVLTRLATDRPEKQPKALPRAEADGVVLPDQTTSEEHDGAEHPAATASQEAVGEQPETERVLVVEDFAPVPPVRPARPAARSESVHESVRMSSAPIPAQRDSEGPVLVARLADDVPAPQPARRAMIGPLVAAARHRAKLSIDTLSERTRIRPHVLECIEVDDFAPCGGDFYARGHLRTLARVFGLDAAELLALYDEHYAHPEIEARQVFEAELATGIGGGLRSASTGPRWSLLAASVVALLMVWGVAHFFTDRPQELVSPAPNVDSAGLTHAEPAPAPKSTLAALGVSAVGASPQVVVRDKDGRILWAGKLAAGAHQQVIGLAPFDVTASNGAAVKVTFLGKGRGTVGASSKADSKQYG